MSKKSKKKPKKKSAKKEKYAKFRKEKSDTVNVQLPDLSPEEMKARQDDEMKINKFLRFNRSAPEHEIVRRKEVSKR